MSLPATPKQRIVQYLRERPEGACTRQIIHDLGINPHTVGYNLRSNPLIYVDRWEAFRASCGLGWRAVYVIAKPPEDTPPPARKPTEADLKNT